MTIEEKNENERVAKGLFYFASERDVKYEFQNLVTYIKESESFQKEKLNNMQINHEIDRTNMEEFGHTFDSFEHTELARILRYSCFVSGVSLLEVLFTKIVDLFPEKQTTLLCSDLAGINLQKPFKYLSKILLHDLSSLDEKLKILLSYNSLRNKIVHEGGYIKYDKTRPFNQQDALLQFANQLKNVSIDDFGRVEFKDSAAIIELCDFSERFLLDVIGILRTDWTKKQK